MSKNTGNGAKRRVTRREESLNVTVASQPKRLRTATEGKYPFENFFERDLNGKILQEGRGVKTRAMSKNNNASIGLNRPTFKRSTKCKKVANLNDPVREFCEEIANNSTSYVISNTVGAEDEGPGVSALGGDQVRTTVNASEDAEFPGDEDSEEDEGLINDDEEEESANELVPGIEFDEQSTGDLAQSEDEEITFKVNDMNIVDMGTSATGDVEPGKMDTNQGDFSSFKGNIAFAKYVKNMVACELEQEKKKV